MKIKKCQYKQVSYPSNKGLKLNETSCHRNFNSPIQFWISGNHWQHWKEIHLNLLNYILQVQELAGSTGEHPSHVFDISLSEYPHLIPVIFLYNVLNILLLTHSPRIYNGHGSSHDIHIFCTIISSFTVPAADQNFWLVWYCLFLFFDLLIFFITMTLILYI